MTVEQHLGGRCYKSLLTAVWGMTSATRIHVRRDGALLANGVLLARVNAGQALELAQELITAAVRSEALGEAQSGSAASTELPDPVNET